MQGMDGCGLTAVYQRIEDGWVLARCLEVPGAVTQGRDLAEAREMLRDAVQELFSVYRQRAEAEMATERVDVIAREPLGF